MGKILTDWKIDCLELQISSFQNHVSNSSQPRSFLRKGKGVGNMIENIRY